MPSLERDVDVSSDRTASPQSISPVKTDPQQLTVPASASSASSSSTSLATTLVSSNGGSLSHGEDDASDYASLAWKKTGVEYTNGPDQILPSEATWTSYADGAIRLRMDATGFGSRKPVSIPTMLEQAAAVAPDYPALCVKRDGKWIKWNYTEYLNNVRTCAKAFIKLGLARHRSVCIIGFNSPEWFVGNLAAIYAGAFSAGVYTTNSPEACYHCAENSKANIFIVEDEKQLKKVLEIRDRLPELKAIVQYEGTPTVDGVLSWNQLMLLGTQQPDSILEDRLKRISINQGCTLIYTSGTTGPPKGVMLCHDNVTWMCALMEETAQTRPKDVLVSYLPLSHIAAQLMDLYYPIYNRGTVYFAGKDALKGGLLQTLKEARPTIFIGVPRVWEKIYEAMQEVGKRTTGLKKVIATWAKAKGLEHAENNMKGINSKSVGFSIANAVIFKKVRQSLGLDRCYTTVSAAAPLSIEVHRYFASLNIIINEAYGMSESTGPHMYSSLTKIRLGSIGLTMKGCRTKLDNQDSEGVGELCMAGRQVFMGYLSMPDKTKEAIDEEGWLHSGDLGRVDEEGFHYVTGRIKELLITAGGENVAPTIIEEAVKSEVPGISNVMLIGDRRKYLSALVTLKTDMNPDTGEPLDTLSPAGKSWVHQVGSTANTVSEVAKTKDPAVFRAIQEGIDRANKNAMSNAQRIQKWSLLDKDFSIPGGELGPTMKLRRGPTLKMYTDVIEAMYA